MFLHLSVSHCVHSGGVCLSARWDTHPPLGRPPRQTPLGKTPPGKTPPGQTPPSRRPLQRTVRILLKCFLVLVLCMGAYLSVLHVPMHFHSVFHFVLAGMNYFHFYRPQTKSREVNVFTSVCLFTAGLYHTPEEPVLLPSLISYHVVSYGVSQLSTRNHKNGCYGPTIKDRDLK